MDHHLRALEPLPGLDLAADDQAAYLTLQLTAEHHNPFPGETTPPDRIYRRGVFAQLSAENVASVTLAGPAPGSAEEIAAVLLEGWMNSPGHRANILNPALTHLGASVRLAHVAGAWYAFGVQDFVRFDGRPP